MLMTQNRKAGKHPTWWRMAALSLITLLIAGLVAACGGEAPPDIFESNTEAAESAASDAEAAPEAAASNEAVAADSDSKEAPALAALVASGELPPLEERLPTDPMVVQVSDSIGQYGGTWRSGLLGQADGAWVRRTMAYEPMMRWTPDLTDTIPNVHLFLLMPARFCGL